MAALISNDAEFFLSRLLREVSRSFYLTLRVLPRAIRPQIGFAYLLARATDTIADTEVVPPEARLAVLRRLSAQLLAGRPAPIDLGELSACQASQGEKLLLTRLDEIAALTFRFEESDLKATQKVLSVITSGQILDLERFGYASPDLPEALKTAVELDDYTYRVAGCVGEFWTAICLAHLRPIPAADHASLFEQGIRFGKGLQLVNILRDLPADLAQGRCYLPMEELQSAGLVPGDLRDPETEAILRPLYNRWLALAREHLMAGWSYTNALPWRWARVRLACAWPILIGLGTIDRLERAAVLDPAQRVKITRGQVRSILLRSSLLYPLPFLWKRLAG